MSTTKKPWNAFATPTIGKAVRGLSRLLHHGGSAFPGKVVEGIDPGFLARTLGQLPYGVVLVSGTNGKTTTTRMVASILRDLGLKVFTNPTGSNFTRGVVSALLTEVSAGGRLDADIAVLELDEAYAVHFVRQVKPRYSLLLNVMRDQLDRFGEIDNTARLLGHVAEATTDTVVLNREDRRISALAAQVPQGTQVRYFGLSDDLRALFPSDDDMHDSETGTDEDGGAAADGHNANTNDKNSESVEGSQNSYIPLSKITGGALNKTSGDGSDTSSGVANTSEAENADVLAANTAIDASVMVPDAQLPVSADAGTTTNINTGADAETNASQPATSAIPVMLETVSSPTSAAAPDAEEPRQRADVVLNAVGDHEAEFIMDDAEFETTVKLEGVYNLFNAAAALAVVRAVMEKVQKVDNTAPRARDERLVQAVSRVTPAFGRGEIITVNGSPVELLLVKNPMGFRLSLASFAPGSHETMIVINDEYADGRDMSWLWDVDFTSLRQTGVAVVSGVRAWDMALRLEYDGVEVGHVDTDIPAAVRAFVQSDQGVPKHIYCTYTSMLQVRSELGKLTQVADAGVGR
ncbi:MurT ligase domain-containing protein [Bifidobacterium sp. ESL0790]|uniref:MurT ligase domain-containing protein n=1 Tax=Bifidobacterium sp. ESL0790 TaxID=2983233 RepID=UPI0023F921A3|nr:MurT ligase domain-containing protein [Bifidobacterium sp. ESL0790]WEV72576.1 MurT ligase domain-containing protein [Bifidobacterium sp. ESL0790]